MAKKMYEENNIREIAVAIREKNGSSETYKVSEMAEAVRSITADNSGVYSFDQRRSEVAAFLDNTTYDPNDYSVSLIPNYVTQKTQNIPNGANVDVTQSGTLVVSDTYSKIVYQKQIESGQQTIYNVTPNTETNFCIISNGEIVQSGLIKPTGACRMVNIPTVYNARDIGGWTCDGGTVKYGKLYRGGQIYEGAYDVFVNQLGIRHELNLRGASESANEPSPTWDEVGYTCPNNFVWYSLADKSTWKEILDCILSNVAENKPLFFHCSVGADRTGTVACVIEALLGVSQSDIDKDYELTCFSTGVATDALARRRNESEWQGLINEINAYDGESFMRKAINFVKSCGIELSKINAFRQAMINGTPEVIIESFNVTKNATNCNITGNDSALNGSTYTATVTANDGYEISSVTITMGGVDISSCYSDGIITIPNVNGDILIEAVANEVITYINKMVVSELNKRVYTAGSLVVGNVCFVCEPIAVDLTISQPVIFKNFADKMGALESSGSYGNSKLRALGENQNYLANWYIGTTSKSKVWGCPISGSDCIGNLTDLLTVSDLNGITVTASQVKYIQFVPSIRASSAGAITNDDLSGLEIDMKE